MVQSIIVTDINSKNMKGFTKEQNENLITWAAQRDAFLLENKNLKVEQEKLQKTNKELAVSSTDMVNRMNIAQGRILELEIKESELPKVISKEVAYLVSEKSTLESEINLLTKLINVLTPQKFSLESDIEKALSTFEIVKGETLLLGKVVDKVTTVSKNNADGINLLVSDLAKSLEEIISVNRKNVLETNVVLDKLPVMLMELQKRGLIKNRQAIIKK